MENPAAQKSTLETLRTVEFRLGLRGYDVDEVDDYLEKVAVEADALQEQLRSMTDRLRQAADRIAQLEAQRSEAPIDTVRPEPAPVEVAAAAAATAASTDSLQRTLEMAQRFVEQTKRESEEEAATVIAAAAAEARRLQAEAEQRYKGDLARLEGLKTKLTTDVELMARQLETERTRLRSSLSEMLQWIEDNVQPGAAIMALRQGSASTTSSGPETSAEAAVSSGVEETNVLNLRQPDVDG